MKIETKKTGAKYEFQEVMQGECFRSEHYGGSEVYIKTDEENAVRLDSGTLVDFPPAAGCTVLEATLTLVEG